MSYPLTPLMQAAAQGDATKCQQLLKQGEVINQLATPLGLSALHLACQQGSVATVEVLLGHGALINLQLPCNGMTPLMQAIWYRHPDCVKFLLRQPTINTQIVSHFGAKAVDLVDASAVAQEGKTVSALSADAISMLAALDEHQNALCHNPLIAAMMHEGQVLDKDKERFDSYLLKLKEVDQVEPLMNQGNDLHTALHVAAREGYANICQWLLDKGASLTVQDAYMQSLPIHKAAYMGHAHVIKVLATSPGFDEVLDCRGPLNGYTPLHDAIWHGHLEAARQLVRLGANASLKSHDGLTPLDLAKRYHYTEIEQLLQCGR